MVKYDEQVRQEIKRLGKTLASLTIDDSEQGRGPNEATAVDAEGDDPPVDQTASAPAWDVFSSRRQSSVLVFHNSQMEQIE
jgi:type IV secretion system protein VirB1